MDTFEVWNGSINCYLDQIHVEQNGSFTVGNYGGCTKSSAVTNEDGLIYMESENGWRFAVLMDSHTTNESVLLLTSMIENKLKEIKNICSKSIEVAIPEMQKFIIKLITDDIAKENASSIQGETAALFCFEKEGYLWWLSVGDNLIYLFQKEFNELGQYRLNQRVFYQWYGQQNSLALKVPCYSSGAIQLREGTATIVMLTDGVLEISERIYENDLLLAKEFKNTSIPKALEKILTEIKRQKGRDSATIIAWKSVGYGQVLWPTRL